MLDISDYVYMYIKKFAFKSNPWEFIENHFLPNIIHYKIICLQLSFQRLRCDRDTILV